MTELKLAVIHWFPIEQYPPVTNLLTYLATDDRCQVTAYTCRNDRGIADYDDPKVTVHRCSFPSRSLNRLRRYLAYFGFPVAVFSKLLVLRPRTLLYIEPHSAMPAFLYCLFARRCRLFIHYHEYHDTEEFLQPGMRVARFYHWIEKRFLFPRAEWISQTNEDRRRLFHEDHSGIPSTKLMILPNYPPRSWYQRPKAAWNECHGERLQLVYVGSISLHDTFIEPLVRWVGQYARDVSLDIFSYNNDPSTRRFLHESQCENIQFHPRGIAYDELPDLLCGFHVGLILYRGSTRNYIYNASNKLFEYLAIGLDVWYPPRMLGVKPFAVFDVSPRVVETDFEQLEEIDLGGRRDRSKLPPATKVYCCEDALRPLRIQMEFDAR